MKNLILCRGAAGQGKSTYAKSLNLKHHFEADDYFIIDGKYIFNPKLLPQAHAQCLNKTIEAMKTGEDIVVANTFCRKWEMEKYIEAAKENGYSVEIKVMTGNYQNVHNVPAEVVQRQKDRFEY